MTILVRAYARDQKESSAEASAWYKDALMSEKRNADDEKFFAYLKAFLVPTLLLKVAIVYFGIHYSNEPGEGYGWGLLAAIALSLFNFAVFIYKNWNETEE